MAARSKNARQTAIGVCGHIVEMWSHIRRVGVPTKEFAVCDECTREQLKLPHSVDLDYGYAWVEVAPLKKEPAVKKERKPRQKKVRCGVCSQSGHIYSDCPLVQQDKLV